MIRLAVRYAWVALLLAGSATLLFSCENADDEDAAAAEESMMTEYSENLSVVMSRNGLRSYFFKTPLLEGYTLAKEPYREFRKGVKITTYQDDSLSSVNSVLTANYAIYYEKRELWEAKGNVVVEKSDGKTLYTQQLFWNARTKKIYSNVDSKIVQNDGRDVFVGEGFESDEEFRDWRFRRMKGRMEVEVKPTEDADSTASTRPVSQSAPTSSVMKEKPVQPAKSVASAPTVSETRPARSNDRSAAPSRTVQKSRVIAPMEHNYSIQPAGKPQSADRKLTKSSDSALSQQPASRATTNTDR